MNALRGIIKRVLGRKGRIGRVWLRRSRAGRSYRDSGARSRLYGAMSRPPCRSAGVLVHPTASGM